MQLPQPWGSPACRHCRMPFGSFARNSSSPELWEGRNGAGLLATSAWRGRRRQRPYRRHIGNPRTSIVSIRDALRLVLQDYCAGIAVRK